MAYSAAYSQAIEIILYIVIKSDKHKNKYLTIQKISEGLNIPVPSVKKLVSHLKNSNLISSKSGMSGGLSVTNDLEKITLYDIFIAIEGQNRLFKVHEDFDISQFSNGEEVGNLIFNGTKVLLDSEKAMLDTLRKTSLASLF